MIKTTPPKSDALSRRAMPWYVAGNLFLRGGRVTKFKGMIGSIAPQSVGFATVLSALSLGAAVVLGASSAYAGTCTAGPAAVCSGPAGADTQQTFSPAAALTITTTPGFGLDVASGYGITVSSSNGDVSFTDANASVIRANGRALDINATGAGVVNVSSNGQLIGETNYGLYLYASQNITSSTVSVNDVTSENYVGMWIENAGGALSFTSTGTIQNSSFGYTGLNVTNYATATGGVTLNVNNVSGAGGISLQNSGSGDATITATGSVNASVYEGIYVNQSAASGALTLNVNDVNAARDAVATDYSGNGAVTLDATGTLTGGRNGVRISTAASSTDLVIDAQDIEGGVRGVWIEHRGTGAVDITAQDVTGTAWDGFRLDTLSTGTDLTLTARNVIGGNYGIYSLARGTGDASYTVTGLARGGNNAGIYVSGEAAVKSLTINANDSVGGMWGIYAINAGSGPLAIHSTGSASGGTADGIRGDNYGTDLTIDANESTGNNYGIVGLQYGTGDTDITVTGTATGRVNDGIYVVTNDQAKAINITVNNANGANNGITTIQHSDAGTPDNDVTINVNGVVTGNTDDGLIGWGIWTESDPTVMTRINVAATGVVQANNGNAIINDDGDSIVDVVHLGSVIGNVNLGDGTDVLNYTGEGFLYSGAIPELYGRMAAVSATNSTLNGGNGFDTLNLTKGAGTGIDQIDGSRVFNWEVFNVDGMDLTITNNYIGFGPAGAAGQGTFLTNGSVLRSAEATGTTVFGNLSLADGTSYVLRGDGTTNNLIAGDVANSGDIDLSTPWLSSTSTPPVMVSGAGDRLTMASDYAGNGGRILIDTVLGDDASTTDLIVINGAISGTSTLVVNNLGGTGAATTNGILVVQGQSTTDGTEFALEGNVVRANRFVYSLDYKDNGWYLISQEAGLQGAVATPAAALSSFGRLPTLEQRVGQRLWSGAAVSEGGLGPISGAWVRLYGMDSTLAGKSGSGADSIDSTYWGLQTGIDFLADGGGDGNLVLGATAQFGKLDASALGAFGTDKIDVSGYGVGLTATWYGDNGLYVDGQLQANRLDMSINDSTGAAVIDGHGANLFALSAEVGKRFALDDKATLVPQAQLSWARLSGGTATTVDGEQVGFGNNDATTLRIGVAYEYKGQAAGDKIYGIANLYTDLGGKSSVEADGESQSFESAKNWLEIGVGGTHTLAEGSSLYGEASYAKGLGGSDSDRLSGTVGVRFTW